METTSNERLKKLVSLLELEREEDYRLYREQFYKASFAERRKNGLTWYPVELRGEEPAYGDYIQVNLERATHLNESHQFAGGKNVVFFSNKNNELKEIKGTIKHVQKNTMAVILRTDELPDWAYEGKLGVNLQFDEQSYEQMNIAMEKVISDNVGRLAELKQIFEGEKQASFEINDNNIIIPNLNLSQNKAIRKAVAAKDIFVIHGPPGTGKTTTLVQAIRIILQKEKQVLVCAPTNAAVDLLVEKLMEQGINVLRLGHPARVSEDLSSTTLDGRIQEHKSYKEIKNLKKTAEEYFRMASKYKRTFGKEEREQRALFYNEARKCLTESKFLEDYIQKQLLQESQVIACTPVISASYLLKEKSFETLFFDEASQALEPMTWIPLIKSNRVIFAGDHFQLPPVVKSRDAIQGGLSKTMLERCIKFADCSELLNKQYRMHHQIMEFSNNYFYEGKLEADITVKDTVISRNENDELLSTALEFIDTAGCGFEEQINLETLSSFNPDEVKLLFKHLRKLSGKYLKEFDKNNFDLSVGIITPYRHQQEFLRQELNSEILDDTVKRNIEIKTIDGFQGEEKDIIYISFVRSNQKGEIGFLSDVRRTNVAITRAKKKLIMIGDSATLASNEFYRKLIEYCETKNAYSSAWNLVNEE